MLRSQNSNDSRLAQIAHTMIGTSAPLIMAPDVSMKPVSVVEIDVNVFVYLYWANWYATTTAWTEWANAQFKLWYTMRVGGV